MDYRQLHFMMLGCIQELSPLPTYLLLVRAPAWRGFARAVDSFIRRTCRMGYVSREKQKLQSWLETLKIACRYVIWGSGQGAFPSWIC